MSTNLQSLIKWLPQILLDYEDIFSQCKNVQVECYSLIKQTNEMIVLLKKTRSNFNEANLPIKEIDDIATKYEQIAENLEKCFTDLNKVTEVAFVVNKKLKLYKELLWKTKLQLCYFVQTLLQDIVCLFVQYGDEFLRLTLRISSSYNNMLSMDTKYSLSKNINYVCNNTCPYVLFPLKKFSVTRLLQILSINRAENCCYKLIDCLLQSYRIYDNSDDEKSSDNSSFEIYLVLTKHLSPSMTDNRTKQNKSSEKQPTADTMANFENIDELISSEQSNVVNLLNLTKQLAPAMLGKEGLKRTKTGEYKLSGKTIRKVLEYYDQMLWAEVGNYLEHVILWWAHNPLSAKPPRSSQNLREWIVHFIPTANVPNVVLSALTSLADALTVYITTTLWDQSFRQALVASKTTGHPQTGPLFSNVLQELVNLCNICESTTNWIVGAPLDELPIVEQIPALHRLDHSIHTTRLWTISECRKMASDWNVEAFFTITHKNTVTCLSHLNNLKLADHTIQIEKGGMAVHVEVCTLMRAKLVSEVQENLVQLKETPTECVDCLASICKIINLANLQMIFPPKSFWSTRNNTCPNVPCRYVEDYLDKMLIPVLKAIDNEVICNKILTLICESWLDHIYTNKIKFSRWGARQLLCDFASVNIWIEKNPIIKTEHLRNKLVRNEVLRRCEGVGKLLLRCPGERLKMLDKKMIANNVVDQNGSEENQHQQMPAEMYVPNQEQWLALRALKNKSVFNPFCC